MLDGELKGWMRGRLVNNHLFERDCDGWRREPIAHVAKEDPIEKDRLEKEIEKGRL